jgi:heptosyltransferase-2
LRALRKYVGPEGRIVGVMRPYVAEVLAGNAWIDQSLCYQKGPAGSTANAVRQLRAARLDAVVLLTNSLRTAWMAWRSGTPRRIGYARDGRGWLLTTKLYEPRERGRWSPLPQIDSYLNLAYALGCEWEPPRLELATTAADEALADDVWRQLGLTGQQVAMLNTGGAFGAAKDWPAEHFSSLAQRIVQTLGMHVLVNCGPNERDTAREIARQAGDPRVVSLADQPQLPIGLTKACIRRAQLLVTTDSGPRFFGVAFGVPTVTLFGPTSTRWTRTHSALETSVSLGLQCQPCMARTCPLGHHRCMRDLSVEMVLARVGEQLAAVTAQKQAA